MSTRLSLLCLAGLSTCVFAETPPAFTGGGNWQVGSAPATTVIATSSLVGNRFYIIAVNAAPVENRVSVKIDDAVSSPIIPSASYALFFGKSVSLIADSKNDASGAWTMLAAGDLPGLKAMQWASPVDTPLTVALLRLDRKREAIVSVNPFGDSDCKDVTVSLTVDGTQVKDIKNQRLWLKQGSAIAINGQTVDLVLSEICQNKKVIKGTFTLLDLAP
jgi:hypothetical protein